MTDQRTGRAVKISVTNIGPVRKADIELAPLTVFIGPNNTGKSVLATVIYAVLNPAIGKLLFQMAGKMRSGIPEAAAELMADQHEAQSIPASEIPHSAMEYITRLNGESIKEYLKDVESKLATSTGTSISNLRRIANKRANPGSIAISSDDPAWQGIIDVRSSGCQETVAGVQINSLVMPPHPKGIAALGKINGNAARLAVAILASLIPEIVLNTTYYLPAARSGILQSQKSLTETALQRSALLGLAPADNPLMTGIVSDFLTELNRMDPKNIGEFADEAERLEREVLHGQIVLRSEPSFEVSYRVADTDYSVARMSSMVSELAPIVLYLRHRLQPRDTLIIEEPEGHLHPAAQVALARCLVRLVNRGLKVCLTTHSEYFLEQMNSMIIADQIPEGKIAELNQVGEQLRAEKVAAYFFEAKESGTIVTRLPINPKEGIPNLGFDAVTERQYNDLAAMNRWINEQEG